MQDMASVDNTFVKWLYYNGRAMLCCCFRCFFVNQLAVKLLHCRVVDLITASRLVDSKAVHWLFTVGLLIGCRDAQPIRGHGSSVDIQLQAVCSSSEAMSYSSQSVRFLANDWLTNCPRPLVHFYYSSAIDWLT